MATSGCDSRHSRNSASSASRRPSSAKSDGPQPFQHAAVELLQRVDLLQHRAAVFSHGLRTRVRAVGEPHQRAGMRAQRKQIGPELVVQFARDLLALDILQRHRALGQPPLVLDRLAERRRQMIELVADRGELGRAARRRRGRHNARPRCSLIARASDWSGASARPTTSHRHQKQRDRDRRADLELGDDAVPDLRDLVVRMRGDHQRTRLAMDRDRHAHRGLLRMNQG